jgi:hypothetical protein
VRAPPRFSRWNGDDVLPLIDLAAASPDEAAVSVTRFALCGPPGPVRRMRAANASAPPTTLLGRLRGPRYTAGAHRPMTPGVRCCTQLGHGACRGRFFAQYNVPSPVHLAAAAIRREGEGEATRSPLFRQARIDLDQDA